MNIVVLAAGDFPTHETPLRALREADFVVCCDSAYRQWSVASGQWSVVAPFVVIGDGDSLAETDKATLGDRWVHIAEQDYNDLHKAMQWVSAEFGTRSSEIFDSTTNSELRTPNSELRITILGATGRREDHTLGNISYLVTFAEEYPGIDIEMLTDHGRCAAMNGSRTFASLPRQQVSLFTMDPAIAIHSEGLRWPLNGFHARRWWQASLNEALGDSFTLNAEGWLIVFQTYGPKTIPASV